ncbi:hypothetical protein CFRS1_v004827 [Colletotrichum fructicola]|nr:hypothetical protein CFRS1_v004827 [Colletotrichum fructicola]
MLISWLLRHGSILEQMHIIYIMESFQDGRHPFPLPATGKATYRPVVDAVCSPRGSGVHPADRACQYHATSSANRPMKADLQLVQSQVQIDDI